MGLETVAAISIGSQLIGQGVNYFENRSANQRANNLRNEAAGVVGGFNSGQDAYMQYLRSNPGALDAFQFNASDAFKQYSAQDAINTRDQVDALRSSAGSLGARFGSGFAAREAGLRAKIAADQGARNAGIAQRGFEFASSTGLNAFLQQRQQQLAALGFQASVPQATGLGTSIAQSGSDIGSLLTLMQYLQGAGANKTPGVRPQIPTTTQFVEPYYDGGRYPG